MTSTLLASAASTPDTVYTLLYIVLGAFGIGGIGGIAGIMRSIRKGGVRDANVDLTVKAVMDPETGTVVKIDALQSASRAQAETLKRIEHKMTSNGLGSNNLGDIAKRTENAVKQIDAQVRETNTKLDTHIGTHDERDAQLAARLTVLERPPRTRR